MTRVCNLDSQRHPWENCKWLASELKHLGWTSYATLTNGSCSIQGHLGFSACRISRTLSIWTLRCCSMSETGSASMRHQARDQNRRRLGMICCVGLKCCRRHWYSLCRWSGCLYMIAVVGFDTCAPWIPEDMSMRIFFCWHRIFHCTCHRFDKGRYYSTCYGRLNQSRSVEQLRPRKKDSNY